MSDESNVPAPAETPAPAAPVILEEQHEREHIEILQRLEAILQRLEAIPERLDRVEALAVSTALPEAPAVPEAPPEAPAVPEKEETKEEATVVEKRNAKAPKRRTGMWW